MTPKQPQFMDTNELAAATGVSRQTLFKYMDKGLITPAWEGKRSKLFTADTVQLIAKIKKKRNKRTLDELKVLLAEGKL